MKRPFAVGAAVLREQIAGVSHDANLQLLLGSTYDGSEHEPKHP
jgi:hypothetical protein